MIFAVIPCPDNKETSLPALLPVTNYSLTAMEGTRFLSERRVPEKRRAWNEAKKAGVGWSRLKKGKMQPWPNSA